MKNILLPTLITGAVLALSACGSSGGGGTPAVVVSKFNGTWNGGCQTLPNNRSMKQQWKINADGTLDNNISAWVGGDCPGSRLGVVKAKAEITYEDEVEVSHTCKAGEKAQGVILKYVSLDAGPLGTHLGENDINTYLNTQGIKLPKYNLVCIGENNKLYTGLITPATDGSTKAKRPTEMDQRPENSFTPSS